MTYIVKCLNLWNDIPAPLNLAAGQAKRDSLNGVALVSPLLKPFSQIFSKIAPLGL